MRNRLFALIIIALLAGALCGALIHASAPSVAQTWADYFGVATDVFLRLVKMIVGPLVLTTLTVGIAHIGGGSAIGRIGAKTIVWFIGASLFSLFLGLVLVNLVAPGRSFADDLPDIGATAPAAVFSLREFIINLVPRSLFEALANNEILQIVVFSVFAGLAIGSLGERAAHVLRVAEQAAQVMIRITDYVMRLAPIAVFAAIAAVISIHGLGVIGDYGLFVGGFYGALAVLWFALACAGRLAIGARVWELIRDIREPVLLAFSTASSEAAYPKLLDRLERFGVANRIASFVLPLGYSFNLDGSMMYCAFATIFIAQAYGVDLSAGQQILMLLFLMVASKGMAAVPRASIVVIAATLSVFGLPQEGLVLILAVDQFLDMGRSATNVVGNSIATAVIAKWEGLLRPRMTPVIDISLGEKEAGHPVTTPETAV